MFSAHGGEKGDDVTDNVKTIRSIPLVLHGDNYPDSFEIRGEILMPWEVFEELNREKEAREEPLFANPRNAAVTDDLLVHRARECGVALGHIGVCEDAGDVGMVERAAVALGCGTPHDRGKLSLRRLLSLLFRNSYPYFST